MYTMIRVSGPPVDRRVKRRLDGRVERGCGSGQDPGVSDRGSWKRREEEVRTGRSTGHTKGEKGTTRKHVG